MQKLFTKTVFIRSGNNESQVKQLKTLKIGQWITGINLDSKAIIYRGQFMGFDNAGFPIINFRLDCAKRPLDWKEQFKSNKPLREFARIKC